MHMPRLITILILLALAGCGTEPDSPSQTESRPAGDSVAAAPVQSPPPLAAEQETSESIEETLPPVTDANPQSAPPPEIKHNTDAPEPASDEQVELDGADPPAPRESDPPAVEQVDDGPQGDDPAKDNRSDKETTAPEQEAHPPDTQEPMPDQTAGPVVSPTEPQEETAPADPVADLLLKLEKSAADLHSFTADVLYQTEDALLGQQVTRKGSIIYRVVPDTDRKSFAILFDQTIESGRLRERRKHYIFDNRWLVEVDHAEKTFIKREIVPPGRSFDPLKLGEGPFPLPVGQSREEVLARFDATLLELPAEGALAKLADTTQVHGLRLVPKVDSADESDIDHIDLFYDRQSLLPVGVEVIATNDDRKTARLENLRKNPALTDEQLKSISTAEPDPTEWRIDVRPWQDAGR